MATLCDGRARLTALCATHRRMRSADAPGRLCPVCALCRHVSHGYEYAWGMRAVCALRGALAGYSKAAHRLAVKLEVLFFLVHALHLVHTCV